TLRRLKHAVIGQPQDPLAHLPLSTDPCRTCADPCDEGHDEYPKRFTIDTSSDMLGSVKPYRRQVVISTGKSDWASEVTFEPSSLAWYLAAAARPSVSAMLSLSGPASGVFKSAEAGKTSILNGSHHSLSEEGEKETVLVFPDYVAVEDVPRTRKGADALWERAVSPAVGRAGAPPADAEVENEAKMWVLPYVCVILLCSHKRRDNRCAIAAPKLEEAFTQALAEHSIAAHTQLDPCAPDPIPPLQAFAVDAHTRRTAYITAQFQSAARSEQALILRCSHVGGHKYAGVCTIYTPRGAGIWYGRVSPHEVPAVVRETVLGGRVLPKLLRGGVDL
ncbi:hypothetical protein PLICRDRAFT_64201, partial [Plicaturopsis crispa FD-325 SS-3]